MQRITLSALFLTCFVLSACQKSKKTSHNKENNSIKVVSASEVEWQKLNPARGDKSPRAADLWGNRKQPGATGFLVRFVDRFRSPPHIHNVTYRAVVLDGLIHNDDPSAKEHWMPAGSFWTQPKGEAHITAARGKTNIAYVEIDKGPYLVLPTQKAFDSGERPINMDRRNVVWLKAPGAKHSAQQARIAYLWGDPEGKRPGGCFIRLPQGFEGSLQNTQGTLHAVLIKGMLHHQKTGKKKSLAPGSFFSSEGTAAHHLSCQHPKGCLLYLRVTGKISVETT